MNKHNKEKLLKYFKEFKAVDKRIISSYQEGYIGKKVYQVTLNDGSNRKIEQITKRGLAGDAAVIIPITLDNNIIMVVQSRPNTKETVSIELPAGMVDSFEEYKTAAVRELMEETGFLATSIYELECHYQDQGCSEAIVKTFVAEGCKKIQDKKLDGGEKLEYIEISFEDVLEMIKSNYINDANTKIAIMQYILKMKGIL